MHTPHRPLRPTPQPHGNACHTRPAVLRLAACMLAGLAMILPATGCGAEGEIAMKVVRYEDFGAVGDGKTDDIDAIVKAHDYANEHGLPVVANDDATYYISGKAATATIRTDTDFGKAKFIIDDREVENRGAHVFIVPSEAEEAALEGVTQLKRNQANLGVKLPARSIVTVWDSSVKQYIRRGNNQNNGSSKTDIFLVDTDGTVDPKTPIIWDFDQISKITAKPVETRKLTIRGGRFTTIANDHESKYHYHSRNLSIQRSTVEVIGIEHRITDEGPAGAPYQGFIAVRNCANVIVRDALLTGHKTYRTIGRAGRPVSMGTYDISPSKALNVTFINCKQTNDINDRRYWGIMGSNYCKNLVYDGCVLSRFDAHKGVANATIRNSTLGHAGLNAIGSGTLLVENTTLTASRMVNLRGDYGSTWEGEFIIRNCVFVPGGGRAISGVLITGSNDGTHDFGYPCFMPERIVIDGLRIDDSKHPENYEGPAIFGNFNSRYKDPAYKEKYPYTKTREVVLRNVTTASGKPLRLSDNPVMFRDVKVTVLEEGEEIPQYTPDQP